jgi:diguanylate cyclase (GGDEF)-like protein
VINLDLRTITLMSSATAGLMSIVLFSAWRSFPKEVRGLGEWTAGAALLLFSAILLGLRGILPDPVSVLGGNGLMYLALGLWMTGTQKFYERPVSWRLFWLLWAITMAGLAWWLLVTPNFVARLVTFSLMSSVLYIGQLILVVRHGERQLATYFFGSMMCLQCGVAILRAITAYLSEGGNNALFDGDVYQTMYLAAYSFMTVMLTVGFATVATRRLQILLENSSNFDHLTRVLNRRGFAEIYAREKARMKRDCQPMTMMSIDLDHFKAINDSFGHAVGDKVLIHVSGVISSALRETDHVARYGGEEFIVLLPATKVEWALVVASRIRASLREARPDGVPAYTISIGIACQTAPEESLDGFLLRADTALYLAKQEGRDRIEVAPLPT